MAEFFHVHEPVLLRIVVQEFPVEIRLDQRPCQADRVGLVTEFKMIVVEIHGKWPFRGSLGQAAE